MKKNIIYLQYGFWKSLREKKDDFIIWEVFKVLSSNDVCTDIPIEAWEKDDLLRIWLQQKANNKACINPCLPNRIESVFNTSTSNALDLCATYLVDNQLLCDGYIEKFGVFCLTANDLYKQQTYLSGDAVLFDQYEKANEYEKCKVQLSSPCNSLIIIDPYLFDEKHYIYTALKPLLNRIMPQKLSIPFHITIFSQPLNCLNWGDNELTKIEDVFPYFYDLIKQIRKDLEVSFTLCHSTKTSDRRNGVKGDFHSRYILTNCLMVHAEDGTDLYGKNEKCGKWSRFVFVWPSLDDNRRKDVEYYYRWIEITSKNIRNPNKCLASWGTKENRLFELVD